MYINNQELGVRPLKGSKLDSDSLFVEVEDSITTREGGNEGMMRCLREVLSPTGV